MQKSKKLRIVFDTNIWISFLLSNKFSQIDKFLLNGNISLLFSEESLSEFLEVTSRPKFSSVFSDEIINKLLDLFNFYGVLIEVKSKINLCRDLKDNFLLSLALDGSADFLITGDEDLLVLKQIGHTKIIKYSTFLEFEL